jgi:hypothetical protein
MTAAGKNTNDPQSLRAEIQHTRADLGETVEALAAKTDVKTQAKKSAARTAQRGKEEVSRLADKALETAQMAEAQLSHDAAVVRDTVRDADVPAVLRRPPVPRAAIAAGGVAVALIVAGALRRRHR